MVYGPREIPIKDLALQSFERGGRRVKLTSTGRVVLEGGRRLLCAAGQLELDARRAQEGWESELRIGLDEHSRYARLADRSETVASFRNAALVCAS